MARSFLDGFSRPTWKSNRNQDQQSKGSVPQSREASPNHVSCARPCAHPVVSASGLDADNLLGRRYTISAGPPQRCLKARRGGHGPNPEPRTLNPTSGTETGRYVLNPEPRMNSAFRIPNSGLPAAFRVRMSAYCELFYRSGAKICIWSNCAPQRRRRMPRKTLWPNEPIYGKGVVKPSVQGKVERSFRTSPSPSASVDLPHLSRLGGWTMMYLLPHIP